MIWIVGISCFAIGVLVGATILACCSAAGQADECYRCIMFEE